MAGQTDIARARARGFTLIELSVVVVIIVLLVTLLIPALGGARNTAKKASTAALQQSVLTAIQQFKADKGRLPGYFSVQDMGHDENLGNGFTMMENVLLELAGGPIDPSTAADPDNGIIRVACRNGGVAATAVNLGLIGSPDGPGYLTLGQDIIQPVEGQFTRLSGDNGQALMPDILDPWGQPLLLWMRNPLAGRTINETSGGTYFAEISNNGGGAESDRAWFSWASNTGMLAASQLGGDGGVNQLRNSLLALTGTGSGGGLPGPTGTGSDGNSREEVLETMEAILGHPAFPRTTSSTGDFGSSGGDQVRPSQPLGEVIIQSAGPDRIFLSNERKKLGTDRFKKVSYIIEGDIDEDALPRDRFDDLLQAGG